MGSYFIDFNDKIKESVKMKLGVIFKLFLIILLFSSCSDNYLRYESSWIISKFKIEDIDKLNEIGLRNLMIAPSEGFISFPSLYGDPLSVIASKDAKVSFFTKKRKDYLVISNDYRFNGTYSLLCLDNDCCTLSLKNDKYSFELLYNGAGSSRIARECFD